MASVILIIKTLSIIIGFSSALINDFLTFKFLKDFEIDRTENRVLQILAGINLSAIFLIVCSLILAIIYDVSFVNQDVLLSTTIILAIITLNEIIFRKIIVAKLANYRIETKIIDITKIIVLRRLAFSLNIVSIISWVYLLLILQFSLNNKIFSTEIILGDYVLISSIAVLIVNIVYNFKKNRQDFNNIR